jgi:hypothetical protein
MTARDILLHNMSKRNKVNLKKDIDIKLEDDKLNKFFRVKRQDGIIKGLNVGLMSK